MVVSPTRLKLARRGNLRGLESLTRATCSRSLEKEEIKKNGAGNAKRKTREKVARR